VKLLLDQNLSFRILPKIVDLYPHSAHVKDHALDRRDDEAIWRFAQEHQFVIVSKDADFYQRSLLRGAPPKFVYLRVGNCATQDIVTLLRGEHPTIEEFAASPAEAVLIFS